MEPLSIVLPIIIYFLLIILLIVCIVLGIKFITTMNKIEKVVDDVQEKVSSLTKIFDIFDFISDKLSFLSSAVTGFIKDKVVGIFKRKERMDEDEEEL